jgi:hypothetical protein
MSCQDYKPTDIGHVCEYYLPNGSCKHLRHPICRELFIDYACLLTPAPPCPLEESPAKNGITRSCWSGRGQGWSGWTLTIFRAISLRIIALVKVVKAKFHISHMRVGIYSIIISIFLSFFSLNLYFITKHPDHLDHPRNHSAFTLTNHLDQP